MNDLKPPRGPVECLVNRLENYCTERHYKHFLHLNVRVIDWTLAQRKHCFEVYNIYDDYYLIPLPL